jgi:fatty acid synthase subunit alpha
MARKTTQRHEQTGRGAPYSTQLFASSQDHSRLAYEYESPAAAVEVAPADAPSSAIAVQTEVAMPPQSATIVSATSQPTVQVPDEPIHGTDIVRALISRKLRRPIIEISVARSLIELCNGKSTLQNELVGDLTVEFGNLPYAPEDLSLTALGEAATGMPSSQAGHPLGKTSSAALNKIISSKMPPRFNLKSVRSYLSDHWGLQKGRQNAILLFALTSEPEARLTSDKSAYQYLDGLSQFYAAWSGVTLHSRSAADGQGTQQSGHQPADPKAAAAFLATSKKLAQKQYEALTEYLEMSSTRNDASIDQTAPGLQAQLDCWTTEFSEDFLDWVSPAFSAAKARRYNAYWRSARQQLLQFHHGLSSNQRSPLGHATHIKEFQSLCTSMSRKADKELLTLARSLGQDFRAALSDGPNPEARTQWNMLERLIEEAIGRAPQARPSISPTRPETFVDTDGEVKYAERPRNSASSLHEYADMLAHTTLSTKSTIVTSAVVRTLHLGNWSVNSQLTDQMIASFYGVLSNGISFTGKQILVTGAGKGSIGAEVVRLLLNGGARVIVTTSRHLSSVAQFYQRMYETEGARGSELTVLPFNQASATDCDQLINHIYESKGLGRYLDALLPFAAASEGGIEIDDIGARSEFVHRLMLTNVLRLLGRIIKQKRAGKISTNPTQVLLPLSPNHGTFGGDGLYSESKLGLEGLLQRVRSESWQDELSICGVKIGWTRSTGLMDANDAVAETIERHGVLTFSSTEMAFNIASLVTQDMRELCEEHAPMFDFSGGLGQLEDCHTILAEARIAIKTEVAVAKALREEGDYERSLRFPDAQSGRGEPEARVNFQVGFPKLPQFDNEIEPLQQGLSTQADPANTVVVVGYSELGPFGSARTRWAWESQGKFGCAALLELAWTMGLVTHVDEPGKDGHYIGWIDCKTKEKVVDTDVEKLYGSYILEHTGIRTLEPELAGYDPDKKLSLEEISVAEDLPAFETSLAVANAFKLRHGEQVHVVQLDDNEHCQVQFKKGASIMLPKASKFSWGGVAGQLPTGFNAARYGIPEDLVRQLDPVSLYAVCCVAEAFYSAGMPDPLEVFKYVHMSEVGNFIGTSMGGALKTRHLYKDLFLGKAVDSDALQDTYANTTAAWVNMLLLGSIGPIKTPVGACATGVEFVDSGFESIMSGKTSICIVGGVDDLQEDEANGFALLKATADAEAEAAKGRLPSEMSRPTAESRAEFVEAHGCGVQLLCRADIALDMGLPIYAIVAGSTMAADGVGRSVPAPGQGILSFAREKPAPPSVDAALIARAHQSIPSATLSRSSSTRSLSQMSDLSPSLSDSSANAFGYDTPLTPPDYFQIGSSKRRIQLRRAQTDYQPRPRPRQTHISPMRTALERWGLSVDDIGLASLHGTSTKANDINEPTVISAQMDHLGRTPGRPMWAVAQKSVTGHPKAAAAAWMLNGCLQTLQTGIVPGNRNADNIDPAWRKFEHLCLPTTPVRADIRAFTLTSFGFGQKGGQIIGIAPRYLFVTQTRAEYYTYAEKVRRRCKIADREYAKAVMSNKIVRVLDENPWPRESANAVMLDPTARMNVDGAIASAASALPSANHGLDAGMSAIAQRLAKQLRSRDGNLAALGNNVRAIGIDMVRLEDFTSHLNENFIERNFTSAEIDWARHHVNPRDAFAGRWSAKEAVFKSLRTVGKGAGAAMKSIEIVAREGGIPTVLVSAALGTRKNNMEI